MLLPRVICALRRPRHIWQRSPWDSQCLWTPLPRTSCLGSSTHSDTQWRPVAHPDTQWHMVTQLMHVFHRTQLYFTSVIQLQTKSLAYHLGRICFCETYVHYVTCIAANEEFSLALLYSCSCAAGLCIKRVLSEYWDPFWYYYVYIYRRICDIYIIRYTCVNIYITYTCVYTYLNIYIYIYVSYIRMYIYVYTKKIYIYSYVHIYIYTNIHIYI